MFGLVGDRSVDVSSGGLRAIFNIHIYHYRQEVHHDSHGHIHHYVNL